MSSSSEGFVRAGPAQDTIAFLDAYEPGLHARVEAHVGEEAIAKLTHHGRTGWIPLEHDIVFLDGLIDLLGEREARAFFRQSVAQHFKSPLLRTLVSGAERIFGMTPHGLVKLIPRAWPMVYKDIGSPSLEKMSDTHAIVHVRDANPALAASPGYMCAWTGVFEGVVAAGGAEAPRVNIDPHDEGHRLEIHMRW